ncbi:ABC transporter ATP-binding protein [Tsukamurella sp. 8F]|uniref:ABC transporter ATP-binding protein n=1 Tax=unclassified Tsukamurella TaxID=2633480 RepID=UPI0023B94FCE|nr:MULTISPECIES: ABC transporter ATP-binding protein [unclassified Tsukamurella]MDF0531862.1 ABC transporter ATP-binding protein [Tsukamurella sp. 8J]MDF0589518.1 ABC transporter ATP-binding protein [Tsukamurella sp. 8F]
MDTAIAFDGLTVSRGGAVVLDAITARVPRGSITGLLGPSGCGKTTLMRVAVGAQRITSGTTTVLGRPAGARPLRSEVGYVTQSPAVYSDLTVDQNVQYFAAMYPARRATAAADVGDAIAAVGLDRLRSRPVDRLSGGQRSRVSIACALVARPRLLVLDEPTVGLDPVLRAELWERFTSLADSGTTLLVSSHVMDEAAHCARLILLREGRLVGDLTPAELLGRTGAGNLDDAFLALIRSQEAHS